MFRQLSRDELLVIDPRLSYSAGVPDDYPYGNAETLPNARQGDRFSFFHKDSLKHQGRSTPIRSLQRLVARWYFTYVNIAAELLVTCKLHVIWYVSGIF